MCVEFEPKIKKTGHTQNQFWPAYISKRPSTQAHFKRFLLPQKPKTKFKCTSAVSWGNLQLNSSKNAQGLLHLMTKDAEDNTTVCFVKNILLHLCPQTPCRELENAMPIAACFSLHMAETFLHPNVLNILQQ